jgi:putative heme transporter
VRPASCLVLAIKAVGVAVPWHRVLLAWSAGIGASSVSPTPGGIGVVEAAMIAALVLAGLRPPQAVAAVLIYRLVNAKLTVAAALFVQDSIRRLRQRSRRQA